MMLSASSGLRYLNKGLWSTNAIYHSLISNTCLCMNKTAECLTFISHNFVSTQQNGCLKRFWLVCYVCMCRLKLVVQRGEELVKELPIHKKSYYTFGRNGAAADVVLDHKSISRRVFFFGWPKWLKQILNTRLPCNKIQISDEHFCNFLAFYKFSNSDLNKRPKAISVFVCRDRMNAQMKHHANNV